ncbi:hypothetical protein [Methanosarcina virus MetMV]|jgi:hypothetical protein|nr:hypothetical protein [Methanosarcina virus MetMV]AZF89991.1 hypothetical protein [Methanosarcina virus MetMV]
MKNLTLKEIRELYRIEQTREACNVFASSGDDKNEARNMYLAAVDYAGEELAVCDTDREKIRAIYEASRSM